jgi:hypothetical protein
MKYYCAVCNQDIPEKVNQYSIKKFDKALCRDHQKEQKGEKEKIIEEGSSGKTHSKEIKKNDWVFNLIKGRIAETMVEALFIKLGFNVFPFGMENTIPGIMDLLKGVKDEVSNEIKRMPDFVIHKDGKAHFIEVKFRKNETFSLKDLEEKKKGEYPYRNALFVVVSKKHIKCISYAELANGKEIDPKGKYYLGDRPEFETEKKTIVEYCKYAVKFFEFV